MLLDDERHVIKWLSQYGALTKTQVIRLLRDKTPETAEKILRNLKREHQISDVAGGYYLALDGLCKPDQRTILAVWVLLRFIDYVDPMAHYPAVYPSQIFFLKENTGYEIVVLYDGEQHLSKLLQPQDDEMKYIFVLPNIAMASQMMRPKAPCLFATVNFAGQEEPDITFYTEELLPMDSINSFIHLLDKIETQDRRLGMTIKNLRCLTGGKSMELAYAMALKLAEESEKLTLLTRALPAYTGNPRALQDVDAVAAESVPIEAGFTIEGWFCIRLPLLLPKKERGSASYIRGILYPALRNFFQGKAPVRYPESIMIFRHVYEKGRPERRYRDHDNIEINMVSDTVAMYVLTDDAPPCCDHFYCSAASTQERTEVYVVPARDFPQWLVLEPLIPDEGVMLHENVPEQRQKHV